MYTFEFQTCTRTLAVEIQGEWEHNKTKAVLQSTLFFTGKWHFSTWCTV